MTSTEIQQLLDDLCVQNGFCLPRPAQNQLIEAPPDDADAFARAVFTAEGVNPDYADRNVFRVVRDRIAEAMRRSEFAASSK